MKKGIFIFAVFLFLVSLTVLNSCSIFKSRGEKPEKNLIEVIVMEKEHSLLNLPVYAAIEKGFFADQGLEVRLEVSASKEEYESALFNEIVHFILSGPEMNIYLRQKDSKIQNLQIAQIAQYPNFFLLARDNHIPFEWKNLKGKVILGYNEGDASQLIFQYMLRKNDLHPLQDVHIVHNLPYNLRFGAFKSGSGHFILAAEPEASLLELEGTGQVVSIPVNDMQPVPTTIVLTSSSFAASNNETCQNFVNGLYQGLKWVHAQDPETLSLAASKYFPEQEKALLRAISRLKTRGTWLESPVINIKSLTDFMNIMDLNKELIKPLPSEVLCDNTFAENAVLDLADR